MSGALCHGDFGLRSRGSPLGRHEASEGGKPCCTRFRMQWPKPEYRRRKRCPTDTWPLGPRPTTVDVPRVFLLSNAAAPDLRLVQIARVCGLVPSNTDPD